MAIEKKQADPVGITNTSGEPEIVLEVDGLVISMNPPGKTPQTVVVPPSDED